MNNIRESTHSQRAPWYTVIEVWLIIVLLVGSVAASLGLVATAIMRPDAHIIVPDDVPRPSHLPPIKPAGERASQADPQRRRDSNNPTAQQNDGRAPSSS